MNTKHATIAGNVVDDAKALQRKLAEREADQARHGFKPLRPLEQAIAPDAEPAARLYAGWRFLIEGATGADGQANAAVWAKALPAWERAAWRAILASVCPTVGAE